MEARLGSREVERDGRTRRIETTEQQIDIRDRERSTFAIARRAWTRSRAVRSDHEPRWRPRADGPATGCDGLNRHARCEQVHAFNVLRELVAWSSVDARHVRARAAHIEGDDALVPEAPRRIRRADGTTSGSAEQHVLGFDGICGLETTSTRHHLNAGGLVQERSGYAFEEAPHRTGEVSIGNG